MDIRSQERAKLAKIQTQGVERTVYLKVPGSANSSGLIREQHFSSRERFIRALKFGGACWLLALASVLMPIAHFVLVPGFFIAGLIVPLYIFSQEHVILGGEGACPACGAFIFIQRSSYKSVLKETCRECRKEVNIE